MWLGGSPLPEHEKVIRGYLNDFKVPVPKKARERGESNLVYCISHSSRSLTLVSIAALLRLKAWVD